MMADDSRDSLDSLSSNGRLKSLIKKTTNGSLSSNDSERFNFKSEPNGITLPKPYIPAVQPNPRKSEPMEPLDIKWTVFEKLEKLNHLGVHNWEKQYRDGICERRYPNGTRLVLYKNGTTKEYQANGNEITRYTNLDVKRVFPDGKLVYYFSEKEVTQTTYPDGMMLTEFADGQTEKKYTNGMTEIVFPNHSIRYIYPNGEKEDIFVR
jgi:hypothetical protein